MTTYTITATQQQGGQTISANQAEVLGDAYGRTYATREEAERVARDMQSEVAAYGLDASTTYDVEECAEAATCCRARWSRSRSRLGSSCTSRSVFAVVFRRW